MDKTTAFTYFPLMFTIIAIIIISLAVAYFFFQHFENRRRARMSDEHERKREAFNSLLNLLKEKEGPENDEKEDLPPGSDRDERS